MKPMIRSQSAFLPLVLLCSIVLAAACLPGLADGASGKAFSPLTKSGIQDGPSSWKLRRESGWSPSNLTTDEAVALKFLCRLAIRSSGGAWNSERINAAISVLAFGGDPPDSLQATVYKTCMTAGGMGITLP